MLELPRLPLVLLVEDSEDDAFFFRWSLQKTGVPCDLVHVADGGAARAHFDAVRSGGKPRPDLVFLDLKLPTCSGFELLVAVQQQRWSSPLRIVVLSGSEHDGDVARATALGASTYFVKPVSKEQLHDALAALQPTTTAAAS